MRVGIVSLVLGLWSGVCAAAENAVAAPDYNRNVAPLLRKYCAGCHNATDHEAGFVVDGFADLMRGGEHGPAVLAGDADSSRMIRLLTGAADPKMPPEGEPAPKTAEVEVLRAWIAAGAPGPNGAEPDRLSLHVPEVLSRTDLRPISAVDVSPDGRVLAVARYESVSLQPIDAVTDGAAAAARSVGQFPGKVTAVHFAAPGDRLVTASGVTGLGGVAAVWNVADGALVREFRGHRDVLYDAELSPDGTVLATCSYDREIILWDAESGEPLRTLSGHNGAVYDVAFSPDGELLASAGADDTCKVWRVADGERMDTLGQPLEEQYTIAFSPDGRSIVAGGADNRIRVWRLTSRSKPQINPLVIARFAHEGAVLQLRFTTDGSRLVSIADDRTVKVWETKGYTELDMQHQPAAVAALAVSPASEFILGGMDGSLVRIALPTQRTARSAPTAAAVVPAAMDDEPMQRFEESEPNSDATTANRIEAPVVISGTISGRSAASADADVYRFAARAGEEWILEVNASRSKSPLDSYLEVLDGAGRPIERKLLQAVRDSYFTFRGKNADQTDDFRLFNWEEMELNEFLYANGEVVKLHMYPRGPDSGFIVYPGSGKRYGYFDTTSLSHALGEPCYIVEPHPPGAELIPNGLPVFPLYFENDDEGTRSLGMDSQLTFTAPRDGEYLARLRDVRGLEGDEFTYRLTIRPRQPDFRVKIAASDPEIPAGGCLEFRVTATRLDGFDGPITVDISGLPPGFTASTPLVIEAGQNEALGVLACAADAPPTTEQNEIVTISQSQATIGGEVVSHPGPGFGKVRRKDPAASSGRIVTAKSGARPVAAPPDGPLEFEIAPGETIKLKVQVERPQAAGEVSFGKEGSGRNLPHGVYVDNIGLNGLLLLEGQAEREFFITCAKWVPEQSRLFHLNVDGKNGFTTPPVLLHVRHKSAAAAGG